MFRLNLDNFFELPSNSYILDSKGDVLECNDVQAKSLGGSKPADIIGMNARDIIDKETADKIQFNNQKIIRTKRPAILVERVTLNNECHSFLTYKKPILNSRNKAICLVGTSIHLDQSKVLPSNLLELNRCNTKIYKMIADACVSSELAIEEKSATKLERDCLYYLICGMSAKRIAQHLAISYRTVEYYLCRMKEKFNCTSTIALVVKAISAP